MGKLVEESLAGSLHRVSQAAVQVLARAELSSGGWTGERSCRSLLRLVTGFISLQL